MATDNVTLNAGSGGATLRTFSDGTDEWPAAVLCYATTVSPGANVLQPVTPADPLPVTGTVGISGTVAVTGAFYQATQPISAAALPLPAGAATSAKQPAIGTAGAASSDVLSIQGIAGMTAIKVDGSGVTQPISGTVTVVDSVALNVSAAQSGAWSVGITGTPTVTANAGTNLNTSALALESGGHLASLDTKTPALGQALAAASVPVVLPAAQVTSLTPPTSVGLSAGNNLVGQVAAGLQVASLFNGTTALTPSYAPITASSSGANTIVAGVTGKRIYVLRWSLRANGTVNAQWQDSASNNLSGPRYLTQYASDGGSYCPASIYQTATGAGLVLNLSAAVAVGGELTYVIF